MKQREAAMSLNTSFQNIGLIAKPEGKKSQNETLGVLTKLLKDHKKRVFCEQNAAHMLKLSDSFTFTEMANEVDLAIVVGGDGTLLHAARNLVDKEVPVLGINLGRLGFLVDISPSDIGKIMVEVLSGNYKEDHRCLLECQVGDKKPQIALNDVVFHKWNVARMIEFETWINGSFLDTQRSDGIIVSTPTGSTAYALSGGGPLLSPELEVMSIVPICPHTLSNRPIVISGGSNVSFSVCGKTKSENVQVTCDGQVSMKINDGDKVKVSLYEKSLRLLHPPQYDHFQIIRAKLGWGGQQS